MIAYLHLLLLSPFVAIFLAVYVLGHLIAWAGALLVMVLWRVWKVGRWAWLWSVDKRVSRAI